MGADRLTNESVAGDKGQAEEEEGGRGGGAPTTATPRHRISLPAAISSFKWF